MAIFSSKKQVKELKTALMGGYAFSKLKDEVQIQTILTCIYKRLRDGGYDDPEEKFNTTPAIVQGGFFANAMAELNMPHGVSGFSWTFIPNPFSLVACSQKVTLKALSGIRNLGIDPIKECFPEQPEDNKMVVEDGIKHGQDTYTWANGDIYSGEWEDGKRHGQGTFTRSDGEKYVGEWKSGKMHGQGAMTRANGDKYVGEWNEGVKHGQGTYTYSSGSNYVGEWENNVEHGQGAMTYANGDKYVGEWNDGDRYCQDTMTYASGNKQQFPEEELSKSHGLDLKELNIHDKIDPLVVTVSREEINSGNIEPALSILKQLISSPDMATTYKEKIDIAFHGYDTDSRELFEVPEVRDYVHKLDEKFPFWLYFLSKKHLGLQALLFCFLPPYLTEEAKTEIYPQKIDELLTKCWFPAMNHIVDFVGMSEKENEVMTERAIRYITHGRFT